MNLKTISNIVTSKVGRQGLILSKHSPKIMFVAGVIGVGATVVLACRATLKVDEVLEEHEKTKLNIDTVVGKGLDHYTDQDRKKDLVLLYTKTFGKLTRLYGPSVITGVASIALLTGAHLILTRRNVALTAAYAAIEKGFREYRQRVTDELGPDKEQEFRHGLVDKEIEVDGVKQTVKVAGKRGMSPYARCWDELSTSWTSDEQGGALYNPIFLRTQQAYMNDLLRSRGHVLLNDVFDALGLSRTKEGAVVGWVYGSGGDDYIDFGVFEGDEYTAMQFVRGRESGVWLDFNVDGIVYDKI